MVHTDLFYNTTFSQKSQNKETQDENFRSLNITEYSFYKRYPTHTLSWKYLKVQTNSNLTCNQVKSPTPIHWETDNLNLGQCGDGDIIYF